MESEVLARVWGSKKMRIEHRELDVSDASAIIIKKGQLEFVLPTVKHMYREKKSKQNGNE